MVQTFIAVLSFAAIWLSQSPKDTTRRWGPVFGLLGQPFWFYSSWQADQWGIFTLCFFYTFAWMRGFYNGWIRKQ